MNYPPIFEAIQNDSSASALLGDSEFLRVYPGGEAPESTVRPYATWQVIGGVPEKYINNRPDIDQYSIQVDVWADTLADVRDCASAVRYAIEDQCHVTGYRSEEKEDESGLYRISFDVDWFVGR